MFDIKLNENNLRDIEYNFDVLGSKLPTVISHSINRSLEMVRTEQIRKTTAMYTIKRNKLLSAINLYKSNSGNLSGSLISRGGVIGLDHFKLNPKKRSKKTVSVDVKKGGMKLMPNAFIAYHDGRLGAFEREGTERLPIKRLMGPSAPQMLGEMSIMDYLQGFAEDKFNMRFEHELGRLMR